MLKLITPADLPISVAEMKGHLRVSHDDEDDLIEGYIRAATGSIEGYLRRALEPATWELALDSFPSAEIQLPRGPVASVTSVSYTDEDGAEATVDGADFTVDDRPTSEGWIVPHDGFVWPETMETINAIRIRWVAGTGTPEPVKQAIVLLAAHFYQNREATTERLEELPLGVRWLCADYREFT